MNRRDIYVKTTSYFALVALCAFYLSVLLCLCPLAFARAQETHVYYGYVPPSTSIAGYLLPPDTPGAVNELIDSEMVSYIVPHGHSILDLVGINDNTEVEIWDIVANEKINSTMINKFEKKVFFIPDGTFFKIVASSRIAAMISGGEAVYQGYPAGGTSTFYPSLTGGFRGREFTFMAAPPTSPTTQRKPQVGYNFLLIALEETEWALSDRFSKFSTVEKAKQREVKSILFRARLQNDTGWGSTGFAIGYDEIYHLTTSGDVMVSCAAADDFVAVPAITGGYVGRLFYAPEHVTLQETGRTAAFIVVPLEEGEVTVYDGKLAEIAKKSFSADDVENMRYWYHDLGVGRFELIAVSTGDITFTVGQTKGMAEIDYLGDDITFMGARPDQKISFYVPTAGVIFAPQDLTISIDGGAPIQMGKDSFRLLESGVHSISADKHVVVEVLAAGSGWTSWGSYLIEQSDLDVGFEVPSGFTTKQIDYTMYIVIAAAVIAVLAIFIVRRRHSHRV